MAMPNADLILLRLDRSLTFHFEFSIWMAVAVVMLVSMGLVWRFLISPKLIPHFEIDQAEVGAGSGRLTFKPNWTDRQVAYSIWVELSTRKIGLKIDPEHDVIAEIYDSWYAFFGVTREMLKDIPVQKVRSASTEKIVRLSIDVLNEGLRPHLTQWQARFRRWYDAELANPKTLSESPQDIQKRFPQWQQMTAEMEKVNIKLMRYREKLRLIVMKD
jgi:hypothetical protein